MRRSLKRLVDSISNKDVILYETKAYVQALSLLKIIGHVSTHPK